MTCFVVVVQRWMKGRIINNWLLLRLLLDLLVILLRLEQLNKAWSSWLLYKFKKEEDYCAKLHILYILILKCEPIKDIVSGDVFNWGRENVNVPNHCYNTIYKELKQRHCFSWLASIKCFVRNKKATH